MTEVRILSALRTPVTPRDGALCRIDLHDLAAPVVQAALGAAGIEKGAVDDVILGNAMGGGGNVARLVALAAGLPERVAGLTIDRQCCGGLDAILVGAAMIRAGQADVIVAGGVESYSRRPIRLRTFANGGEPVAYDRPPFTPWPDRDPEMDVAADALASELGISRSVQEDWAVQSHAKALATDLSPEIVPFHGVTRDSFARALTPAIAGRSRVLAGSVSVATTAVAADGAAICVLVSDRVASQLEHRGLRFAGGLTVGGRPELPGIAPVAAIARALDQAKIAVGDLVAAEIMEAYAAQAIACVQQAAIRPEIVNLGGGALARGHPVGASGAINAVRLFHELSKRKGAGIAAIAAAGGLGTALVMTSD